MSRPQTAASYRATIAKLRARAAQLEAQLTEAIEHPPEPDLTGWTMAQRLRTYVPTQEENETYRANIIERLTTFGRNTDTLSEEKVRALPPEVQELIKEYWTTNTLELTALEDHVLRGFMDSFLVPRAAREPQYKPYK